jgi:hypothetical protein
MSPKTLCVVSCTAHKRGKSVRAENLYCSDLFYKSRRYAQANHDSWLILSAKYGLLHPSEIIEPYDLNLAALTRNERQLLVTQVSQQFRQLVIGDNTKVSSLCGKTYENLLGQAGIRYHHEPRFALPIGLKLQALTAATDPGGSQALLDATYDIIEALARTTGLRRMRDLLELEMPESGIYLFLDEREMRLKNITKLRVVRVGTHGVAEGSKASLRNRMRTHYGTASGEGNHRSSIFRLHVGRSLISAELAPVVASWGAQALDRATIGAEREIEQAVSKYLGNLLVLLIDVPGPSNKRNDRAYLEQNLISLLSNACSPLDPPSWRWLGLNSDKQEIRKSGLWNVNHVNQRVDPAFIDVLDHYASVTIGLKPAPDQQLAPEDWQARVRMDTRQLILV